MMTKKFFYAASAFLMLSACTQELVSDIQEQPTLKEDGATIAATINDEPATRVAVDQTGVDGKTTLKWEAGDRVLVASGQRGYTFKGNFAATDIDGDFAMFQEESGSTGTFDAMKLNEAYYPASAWDYSGSDPVYTFPTEQVYSAGTFDRSAMPMIASSSDGNFAFSIDATVLRLNVSTAVENVKLNKITLASKNHSLSGKADLSYTDFLKPDESKSVSLLCNDIEISTETVPFYVVVPAGTYEGGDLTLAFSTTAGEDEKTSAKAFTLEVGKVYDMNLNISPKKGPVDLSADGTANCYIVSEYGPCKFDATKKGHTSESVGTIASAEVLWESFGNDVQPAVGDIVSNVSVKNGIVSFTASGKDGNAVIAVKNAAGDILWSWHIWVCQGFDPAATAQVYNNAGTVMDRNLGATSATKGDVKALGLLYQWGRKDPFLSGQSISSDIRAESTITWPSTVSSNSSNGTIDFVVKHPTTFVKFNSRNYDWYYTGGSSTDNTRWNSSKGMYDPCPKGWKVPDGGSNGLWAKAFGTNSDWITSSNWDSTNKGMDFGSTDKKLGSGEIWYPASGFLYGNDGTLYGVGSYGYYCSYTPYGYSAYYLLFNLSGGVSPSSDYYRANGQSVRCVKESASEPEPDGKDLSADGTANCYIVNEYGPCKFDATKKGHTSESVGTIASAEVLWESFGYDVQPAIGDIVKNVSVDNGIVSFTASGKDGNAVIAVKDVAGDILWSWHIWVCKDFDPAATAQEYYNNAGTVMDRNLGATSATKGDVKALGLLYQWGRKDPFLGGQSININNKAKSTITWPSTVSSDSSNGTIDYVVKHPTTFVTYNSNNGDWYYTGDSSIDNTRWNSSKGVYDPCPKGWKVPDGGSNGLWAKALGSSSSFSGGPWDNTNWGMDFAGKFSATSEVWYPASGYLIGSDGRLGYVGYDCGYWSCTPYGRSAYYLSISNYGVGPSYGICALGQSVRCVKESASEPEPDVKDLSADGTANCYIVSEYGPCKFDATKKGHTSESVGTIASAEVLWESFGNEVQPAIGDIVKNVSVENGMVSFTASGKDGNAVIAVKDASGDILWSWHIWVCKDFDPAATAQVYNNNAGTVMDRNLGATSATKGYVMALGLLYQWGRKDPFLSGESISKSTITWPLAVSSDSSNGTIDFVVKHPTTFVTYNTRNYDWYYTGRSFFDNTRWNSNKGMYDPCPKGWKVPNGGSNGLWAKAFGASGSWTTSSNWDSTNNGMDFGSTDKKLGSGEIWYPASGFLHGGGGALISVGNYGGYWSCTPYGNYAYYLDFDYDGNVFPSDNGTRAYGRSVRCVKQ